MTKVRGESPAGEDVKKGPVGCIQRDIRWLLRFARILGCWPLSEVSVDEPYQGKHGSTSGQGHLTSRHVMSWKAYPPYLCICVTLYFIWSTCFHTYNTAALLTSWSNSTADALVSVPWLGANVVPLASGLNLLFRGWALSKFLENWGSLEKALRKHMACTPHPHLAVTVVATYVIMTFLSVASILVRFYFTSESNEFFGRLFPPPWSTVVSIVQNLLVMNTWAAYLVSEAFVMIFSHHIARYYKEINALFKELLEKKLRKSQLSDFGTASAPTTLSTHPGKVLGVLHLPYVLEAPSAATPRVPCAQQDAFATDECLCRFDTLWELYEKIGELVDEMNCIFSPIILVTFAQFMVTICALAIPILTVIDWKANIGYVSNCALFLIRIFAIVIICARVSTSSSDTGNVVSRGHVRLALAGYPVPYLNAVLSRLAALEDTGISAWGFFTVRRGTLLTFMSLIFSYVVIMLQS